MKIFRERVQRCVDIERDVIASRCFTVQSVRRMSFVSHCVSSVRQLGVAARGIKYSNSPPGGGTLCISEAEMLGTVYLCYE